MSFVNPTYKEHFLSIVWMWLTSTMIFLSEYAHNKELIVVSALFFMVISTLFLLVYLLDWIGKTILNYLDREKKE